MVSEQAPTPVSSLDVKSAIAELEVPFPPDQVQWRVTNTAKDKKRGQIVPYADPRAYADRLNLLFTAQGWTRKYRVETMSNITRIKKGESISSGKILVTCTVTIVGLWSHSGTGEEWADDENGMTSAEGSFVRDSRYGERGSESTLVDWETALPSRLSVNLQTDFAQDTERARNTYRQFGQYSRALDQIRRGLEHKAIERKDLKRICSQLAIPGDFDVAQISWRPDYNPSFYNELSRRARRIYLFRDEYIFELERAVVVETPQLGHATYVFAKSRNMDNFLAQYAKTTKTNIRRNQENIAERLGFVGRVVHGTNPALWLKEIREYLAEKEQKQSR
jgi:hypothetical protein